MQRKLSSLTDIVLHVGNSLALFVLAGRFVFNVGILTVIVNAQCDGAAISAHSLLGLVD